MASRRRCVQRFEFAFHAVHQHRFRRRPVLEVLEGRVVLSTFTVNSLGDAGSGSDDAGDLRYCINQANADDQANQIVFDSTVFGTPQTIALSGSQLELTDTGGAQTIAGPAAAVTISGAGKSRVFQVDPGVTASISGLTISGGMSGDGGGIDNSGTLTISGSTVSDNSVGGMNDGGGGIRNSGTLTITTSTITGNTANKDLAESGGGIWNDGGTLTLTDSTLSDNSAIGAGGLANDSTAHLTDCTISGNSSYGFGGGVFNPVAANLTLTDCTLSGNTSYSSGGGMFTSGTATLTGCTVSGNSSTGEYGGGAGLTIEGANNLLDTIVAGNTDAYGASDIAGVSVSGSHNLVGTGGSGGLANGVDGNIVLTSLTDLGLAPLGNDGGPTRTMALLPASPAIGAGVIADYPGTSTPITTDQRGEPLDSPNPDIGAFQTQGSTLIAQTYSGISDQSITYGTSSVTISGTLADGSQAPVGETVAVTLNGVQRSAAIGSGGAFSTTFNAGGLTVAGSPYTVGYAYTSDGTLASATTSSSLTIDQAGTTTGLSASPTTATAGQAITLTATITVVAPGSGAPTGSVQFFVGSTSLGTAGLSGNTATLATTALPVGTDSLTARYLGDPDFATSTSNAVSVTIKSVGIATTTTLTSSPNPSVFGQAVTLTATVRPSSGTGTPTGTVTFYAGSTPLGSAPLTSKKATLRTTAIPVGSQAINAVYSGNATDAPSTSLVLKQTVEQAATTSSVASSGDPSVSGRAVTFTATVKAEAPGSGTPTGTVTFMNGTTTLGTATLEGGTASLTVTTLPIGSDAITVVYGGDADFKTSTSAVLKQVVNPSYGSRPAVAMGPSAVDQVLAVVQAECAQEALIGDLAFEPRSSTRPWRK